MPPIDGKHKLTNRATAKRLQPKQIWPTRCSYGRCLLLLLLLRQRRGGNSSAGEQKLCSCGATRQDWTRSDVWPRSNPVYRFRLLSLPRCVRRDLCPDSGCKRVFTRTTEAPKHLNRQQTKNNALVLMISVAIQRQFRGGVVQKKKTQTSATPTLA